MADNPAKVLEVTRNSDGTATIKISVGTGQANTQMLIHVFKLTGAQCTTVATRIAQGAIGGAGSAGTDIINMAAATSDQLGAPGYFHRD